MTKITLIQNTKYVNLLECKGNYSATSNNTTLIHWPRALMGEQLLHLVQRWRAALL